MSGLNSENTSRLTGKGVGTLEYVLIAVSLLFISITGWYAINGNFSLAMSGVQHDMKLHSNAAKGALASDAAAEANEIVKTPQDSNSSPSVSTPTIVSEETVVANTDLLVPSTTADKILTTGANGATEALASAIAALAADLLAANKISQADANLLIALANAGHSMAVAQKAYEDAVKSGDRNVTFEGKSYELGEFGDMLGFKGEANSDLLIAIDANSAGNYLAPFANIYQQVKNSTLFSNPAIAQQIQLLSVQISSNADALGWAAEMIQHGQISRAELVAQTHKNFVDNLKETSYEIADTSGSTLTNANSTKICKVGSSQEGSDCTH